MGIVFSLYMKKEIDSKLVITNMCILTALYIFTFQKYFLKNLKIFFFLECNNFTIKNTDHQLAYP
jgi:hypothetical protein